MLPELSDLRHQGRRIAPVAIEDGDRHRAATTVRHEAVVDLELALLAVTILPQLGQRTLVTLKVARGEVVEHQAVFLKVARNELLLDGFLSSQQPIHGRVEVVLARRRHAQVLRERAGVPPPSRRELGLRRHHAGDDHRHDQRTLRARPRGEEILEAQPAHRRPHRLDMAVRRRRRDLEGFGRRRKGLPLQRLADELDDVVGQVREVANRLVLDLVAFPVAAPEQVRRIGLALVEAFCCDDVYRPATPSH